MKAWLICESCIHAELDSSSPRQELIRQCSECARACFAVVSKLVGQIEDLSVQVFDCLVHCRQCAAECDKYAYDNDIRLCRDVCETCGDTVKDIYELSVN